jgi:transposase
MADDTAGEPKSGDGQVEMIRTLRSVRQSALKARTQAANQLQALLVTAPESLRHRLRELIPFRSIDVIGLPPPPLPTMSSR